MSRSLSGTRALVAALAAALTVAACGDPGRVLAAPAAAVGHEDLADHDLPKEVALPPGFSPEGIAFGRGSTFYVGSLSTGAIFRGDAVTGAGSLLVAEQPGRAKVGIKYDARTDRLYVAGGAFGVGYVFDASTGATLAVYRLADPSAGETFVNDVIVTADAAYFTDTSRPFIYRVALSAHGHGEHGGTLPGPEAVREIPLGGDFTFVPGELNANGIAVTPDGTRLIVVSTVTGRLYSVDPSTGHATEIDLRGATLVGGDGILLIGRTLYVVQGQLNQIGVVRLAHDFASGVVESPIRDPHLRFPSTIAAYSNALYAVNARFDVPPGPGVAYQVVRVPR